MRFLADEGVDSVVVAELRASGFDVTYVAELAPSLPDPQVLALASSDGRILITADKDFGELVVRRHQASHGVLLLRLPGMDPVQKAHLVRSVVVSHGEGLPRSFTVVKPRLTRIRHLAEGA